MKLLLCSGWQVVNIGDVAHTPGALALLERHLPEAQVTVWLYKPLTDAARDVLRQRFPRVRVVGPAPLDADGGVADPDVLAAIDEADFLLHGSGPATVAWRQADAFARRTGRPFGVYGVTYGPYGCPERATLDHARFVYFRDSRSLAAAVRDGVRAPVVAFAPDAAFATDLADDPAAESFLRASNLEPGRFLCCLSRLRYTPYWLIPGRGTPFDAAKHARNEAMREQDHAPLRAAIAAVVRQTPMRVLICPEDETQIKVTRENLYDPLPDDVRPRVVWRDRFWLPDETLSVYRRSAGLFGSEMHSPIMCIGSGVPAIVCRWAEQSTKGYMWEDIGLGDWLFDFDRDADRRAVVPAVLAMARDPAAAAARARAARDSVRAAHGQTMATVRREIEAARAARGRPAPAAATDKC